MSAGTIDIAAPIDEVFALFADYARHAEWQTEMRWSAMLTPGPVRAGSHGYEVRRMLGRDVRVGFEVVEHDPPVRSMFRTVVGPLRITGGATFERIAPDATRMRFVLDATGIPGAGWVARALGRRVPEHLDRFRALAES